MFFNFYFKIINWLCLSFEKEDKIFPFGLDGEFDRL